jgi:hypothetical protein
VTYQIGNGGLESGFDVSITTGSQTTVINNVLAGGILITETAESPGGPPMPGKYITVCTDIQGTLFLGNSYTYDTPPTPFSGQSGIKPTWGDGSNDGSAAQAIQNAAYLFYTYGQLTGAGVGGTTEEKAALQLAVWEVLYNTTLGGQVNGSRFGVTGGDSAAISLANTWITTLNALSDVGNFGYPGYLLYPSSLTANGNAGDPPQELLIATPVPEGPTVVAGALLLLPFAATVFKILRRKSSAL